MSCLRCEMIRAKIIAGAMAGLSKSGREIVAELCGRYGDVYYLQGLHIMRKVPAGDQSIYEVRR